MTESVTTETASASSSPFFQLWADGLGQILGQMQGSSMAVAVLQEASPEMAGPSETDLWMAGSCAGGVRGEMTLRLPAASVIRLAQIFMNEPAAPVVDVTADHRDAAMELLRQVAGNVATALKARCGEVQIRLEPAAGAASWPASATMWLRAGDDPQAAWVKIELSAALVAALRTDHIAVAPTADPASSTASTSSGESDALTASKFCPSSSIADESGAKLGLLMDVELALTLRFGSRRLLLREILDLGPGSVVDLDRRVPEPVDLLLEGRVVARGEVVVVDGNYGVRVTEVAPPAV